MQYLRSPGSRSGTKRIQIKFSIREPPNLQPHPVVEEDQLCYPIPSFLLLQLRRIGGVTVTDVRLCDENI